jgi:hypothetical protein
MQTMIRGTEALGLLLRMHLDLILAGATIVLSLLAGSWLAQTLLY